MATVRFGRTINSAAPASRALASVFTRAFFVYCLNTKIFSSGYTLRQGHKRVRMGRLPEWRRMREFARRLSLRVRRRLDGKKMRIDRRTLRATAMQKRRLVYKLAGKLYMSLHAGL